MKLSSKGRYGVRALFDIAFHNEGRPTQIKEISERELIPARFLEQIFQDLKRAGLIGSKRGPRGGYHLARPAEEISVGDVMRALEGAVAVMAPDAPEDSGRLSRTGLDATDAVFRELAGSVERCFDSISIADVCRRGVELGIPRKAPARTNYAI